MAQLTVPVVLDHDDLQRLVNEKIAEAKAQFIPKAEYEARLKADMIAMLTEIQLQMEEYEPKWAENEDQVIASNRTWDDFDDIIQQKINKLKENKDGMEWQEKTL